MKLLTKDLINGALDWAVAQCDKIEIVFDDDSKGYYPVTYSHAIGDFYHPSTNPKQGLEIIESHGISIAREAIEWAAWTWARTRDDAEHFGYGDTPLIAAMRCFVHSKLGDEVDIPLELL